MKFTSDTENATDLKQHFFLWLFFIDIQRHINVQFWHIFLFLNYSFPPLHPPSKHQVQYFFFFFCTRFYKEKKKKKSWCSENTQLKISKNIVCLNVPLIGETFSQNKKGTIQYLKAAISINKSWRRGLSNKTFDTHSEARGEKRQWQSEWPQFLEVAVNFYEQVGRCSDVNKCCNNIFGEYKALYPDDNQVATFFSTS